jgi:hypothetical protein
MPFLSSVSWPLVGGGVAALLLGLWPLTALARRLGRALIGRAQPRWSGLRTIATLALGAALLAVGAAALALVAALQGFANLTRKTQVAEVQCIELAPQKLRVYYVPIESERDGLRGKTEVYDLAGDEWTVGGDVLRFRPWLATLGVGTVYRVTRIEGRWLDAADANTHTGTAFDRAAGRSSPWLTLYRDGARGPLGHLVAGVHGQAVSQLPDRRAVFDLYITTDGLVAEKRSL